MIFGYPTKPLKFLPDMIPRILAGQKSTTIRLRTRQIGDTFAVADQLYRVTNIISTYPDDAVAIFWTSEGCSSEEECRMLLEKIYPNLTKDATVYVTSFAAVICK